MQHKSNSHQADFQIDPYSNFLRIFSTVMHYKFGFGNFDENTFALFTKHSLGKVDKVPISIKNLDESNFGFIYHELMIGGKKLISKEGAHKKAKLNSLIN